MEKYFLNESVLVQFECTEVNEKTNYEVIVFFRHSHEVQIIKTKTLTEALNKYKFIKDLCSK